MPKDDTSPKNETVSRAAETSLIPTSAPIVQPTIPMLLLPEHTSVPRRTLHYASGLLALTLMFFASASLTVAYLSETQPVSAASQASAAAASREDSYATVSLLAQAAYVLDLTTHRILYAKNSDAQLPLASLVKVPLVLAISEVLKPDTRILVPIHTPPDGAGVRLPAGLRFEAQDLIDFTLVASSNEGADILAKAAEDAMRIKYPEASARAPIVWRMNDIAQNLELSHTVFLNINGLDQSTTQAGAYGSAHDVAILFGYAASTAPEIFEKTSRSSAKIRAVTGESVNAVNTDEALPAIPGLIMGKTGYTELAGGNLAIVFEVGPAHPVVAVVLHSTEGGRFSDIKTLVTATLASIAGTE